MLLCWGGDGALISTTAADPGFYLFCLAVSPVGGRTGAAGAHTNMDAAHPHAHTHTRVCCVC